jgi:hypothetical protein
MTGINCDLFTHKSVPVIYEPPCIKCEEPLDDQEISHILKDNSVPFIQLVKSYVKFQKKNVLLYVNRENFILFEGECSIQRLLNDVFETRKSFCVFK